MFDHGPAPTTDAAIRVYPLPLRLAQNPYLDRLYAPMREANLPGIALRDHPSVARRLGEALRGRGPRVLHVHFFDAQCLRPNRQETLLRSAAWLASLRALRARGVRVVWTAHNLVPHEDRHPDLSAKLYRTMNRLCDAVIVHSVAAGDHFTRRYGPPRRLCVIPHGHYVGCYGPRLSRAEARAELGVASDVRLFLALGQLRANKRLEALIDAFDAAALPASTLWITGPGREPAYVAALSAQAAGVSHCRVLEGYVPDAALPAYFAAADAVVIPYATLTSGAVITALSYGALVVAPRTETYQDLIVDGQSGFLFDPAQPDGLKNGLERVAAANNGDAIAQAGLASVVRFGWDGIARQTAALYRSLFESERSAANLA